MISMMNTTRIETRYFLLMIVINFTGDSPYQLRVLKKYGRKMIENGFVYPGIDLNPEIGQ